MTMTEQTITELQRELLRILKGNHRSAAAWNSRAGILGLRYGDAPLPNNMDQVRELRRQIQAIDPNACLYSSWGGAMP